jgi:hypothetical protein
MLNLCYRLAEIECRIACVGVGLDPGLGVIHLDRAGRDSMALDLLEIVRPEVECFVLELVAQRVFRRRDFWKSTDGQVRVLMPLSHDLASTTGGWGHTVAPWAEKVAHIVASGVETKIGRTTPLTGGARRAAQAKVKARKAASRLASQRGALRAANQRDAARTPARLGGCVDCGAPVRDHRHVRCDACIAADPLQSPELRGRRGQAIAARKRALRTQANAGLPPWADRDWYRREVWPRLAKIKLAEIMEVAGCSKGYASDIRRGRYVPHVSTWPALAVLAGLEPVRG